MFLRSTGAVPKLITFGGMVICSFSGLGAVINFARYVYVHSPQFLEMAVISTTIAFIGYGIAGVFPTIQVSEQGIRFSSQLFFLPILVEWNDVVGIKQALWVSGWTAIVLNRKRLFLFGLYWNILYGRIITSGLQPIILIHPSLEKYNELLSIIKERISKQSPG